MGHNGEEIFQSSPLKYNKKKQENPEPSKPIIINLNDLSDD